MSEEYVDKWDHELRKGIYYYGGANLDLCYFNEEYDNAGSPLFENCKGEKIPFNSRQTKRLGFVFSGLLRDMLIESQLRSWLEDKVDEISHTKSS